MDGWKPSIPSGASFELGTTEYTKMEKKGLKELGKVGFVLVAGGLGERLGYSGAKVIFAFVLGVGPLMVVALVLILPLHRIHSFFYKHRLVYQQKRQRELPTFSIIVSISELWSER